LLMSINRRVSVNLSSVRSKLLIKCFGKLNKVFIKPTTDLKTLRMRYDQLFSRPRSVLVKRHKGSSVVKGSDGNSNFEWLSVWPDDKRKTILYIHGGGYVLGSLSSYRNLGLDLSKSTGCKVLNLNYRLAPESPYPAAIDDVLHAYKWLLEQGEKPEDIIFSGDSAGGGLTIASFMKIRDQKLPMPKAGICFSPWTDLTFSGESPRENWKTEIMVNPLHPPGWVNSYVGKDSAKNPYISPLFGDVSGLPPLLIQVSTAEAIYDDSTRFANLAANTDTKITLQEWDDMPHVWQMMASVLPEGRDALNKVGKFVEAL
jgi:epsilon-lactone hydrolase